MDTAISWYLVEELEIETFSSDRLALFVVVVAVVVVVVVVMAYSFR
jgi:hypothetical protein